jgi:palmitoyltransferase
MSILAYHLVVRALVIWNERNLPAYLGPSVYAMAHLFVLLLVNSITLFALGILLVRAIYSLATNTTMIESWEIERHEALIERARKNGGWVYANGGQKIHTEHQEFPYDIGIWKNLCQGMGTSNVILWLLPFGGAPSIHSAGKFEVNGFEDESKVWPPPDPEKMPRATRAMDNVPRLKTYGSPEEGMKAFRTRQRKDYERWGYKNTADGSADEEEHEYVSEYEDDGWTNSDGDRLRDYGVDEDAEVVAEDDIPLGELLRRRKEKSKVS